MNHWDPPFALPLGEPWGSADWELSDHAEDLAGLGSWLHKQLKSVAHVLNKPLGLISKKLEANANKLTDKVADNLDSIHTKINDGGKSAGRWAKKNWKVLAIVAALAITIYSMGSGTTIAAKLLSGCKLIGAKAMAVGGWFGGHAATTTLAMQGASKLLGGKQVSDLSSGEAQAMLDAQANGGNLVDPALAPFLRKRAALGEVDAYGNPIAASSGLPSWLLPAGAAAALLLFLAV